MQEKEQDIILKHQRKRRNHKIRLALEAIILIVIAVTAILSYFKLTKNEYNTYTKKEKIS